MCFGVLPHPLPQGRFRCEKGPAHGNGGAKTVADLLQRFPHDVRVVDAYVGDDADVGAEHLVLGNGLKLGRDGHALGHQDLRALRRGFMKDTELLTDVGGSRAADQSFVSRNVDGHGQGACGFAIDPQSSCTKAGFDQSGDAGLATGTVDVDHVRKTASVLQGCPLFQKESPDKNRRCGKKQPCHAQNLSPALLACRSRSA